MNYEKALGEAVHHTINECTSMCTQYATNISTCGNINNILIAESRLIYRMVYGSVFNHFMCCVIDGTECLVYDMTESFLEKEITDGY